MSAIFYFRLLTLLPNNKESFKKFLAFSHKIEMGIYFHKCRFQYAYVVISLWISQILTLIRTERKEFPINYESAEIN